jgi:hypothetical protein
MLSPLQMKTVLLPELNSVKARRSPGFVSIKIIGDTGEFVVSTGTQSRRLVEFKA